MNMALLRESAQVARRLLAGARPAAAVILGSGWGPAADALRIRRIVSYADIPHLGATSVAGHSGRLIEAECGGVPVLVFQGRRHWYEGAGWEPVALPVFLAARLGARTLIVTNACGGIREDLAPGALMVIDDHINAMGANPLAGEHHPEWGTRFPDQSEVYDPALRRLLDAAAERAGGSRPAHGIYAAVSGPCYETPAECAVLSRMGADAVGMSTVPEATLAAAAGLRVVGLSCIANRAAGLREGRLTHEEVAATIGRSLPRMSGILAAFLPQLADQGVHA